MTHALRIAHLRIAHQVANPKVGKREKTVNIVNLGSFEVAQIDVFDFFSRWVVPNGL